MLPLAGYLVHVYCDLHPFGRFTIGLYTALDYWDIDRWYGTKLSCIPGTLAKTAIVEFNQLLCDVRKWLLNAYQEYVARKNDP